jgi:hypothetical protein
MILPKIKGEPVKMVEVDGWHATWPGIYKVLDELVVDKTQILVAIARLKEYYINLFDDEVEFEVVVEESFDGWAEGRAK